MELEKLQGEFDVHSLCEALDVPRGTFYNHVRRNKRENTVFEKRRKEYRVLIQDVFNEFHQVIGADKIRAVLVERGHVVSEKFVAELMKEMQLSSVRTSAKKDYLMRQKPKRNIVDQKFSAETPNIKWVSDVTCFKVDAHYYFVCAIIDLFSRKVVAYKISKKNSTQLLTRTFKTAYEERKPTPGLIFHSDRGAQYTSGRFQQLLHEYGVVQSFSKPGTPHDNAVAEAFFGNFKKEELYRRNITSEKEFYRAVERYIEFYNVERPHRTLKNLTPCQAEKNYYASLEGKKT